MDTPRERLDALPAAGLGSWPTPLHRLDHLSARLGTEVWIKRDDVQGIALAGNKIRKFDVVIGQALREGADTLVTTGAAQSNSARAGAAAAAASGLRAVLLLGGEAPVEPTANLLIDHLVGAEIRWAGAASWAALNEGVDRIVAELQAAGQRPFAAPLGCSSPLGALGFARAFLELEGQAALAGLRAETIVHTTTSGGTHAGLLVGRALAGSAIRLVGVDAGRLHDDHRAACAALARDAAAVLGLDLRLAPADVEVIDDQLGEGYGIPTEPGLDAIELLARTEGILLDPVYSGKGFAGLLRLVRDGSLRGPVVFWHTGGTQVLFDPRHGAPLVRRDRA
jgi:1-aminocyclopropane-1-carboxylate deaminase/D-cysteine desulfhydrase